jgi:hypothetical protein
MPERGYASAACGFVQGVSSPIYGPSLSFIQPLIIQPSGPLDYDPSLIGSRKRTDRSARLRGVRPRSLRNEVLSHLVDRGTTDSALELGFRGNLNAIPVVWIKACSVRWPKSSESTIHAKPGVRGRPFAFSDPTGARAMTGTSLVVVQRKTVQISQLRVNS